MGSSDRYPLRKYKGQNLARLANNIFVRSRLAVWKCRMVAKIPGGQLMADYIDKYHEWIWLSDGTEAGLGASDGVPGEARHFPDVPGSPTYVVDHTDRHKQPGVVIEEIFDVDFDCVKSHLVPAKSLLWDSDGPWTPLLHDCNTWVSRVIRLSTPREYSAGGDSLNKDPHVFVVFANGEFRSPDRVVQRH